MERRAQREAGKMRQRQQREAAGGAGHAGAAWRVCGHGDEAKVGGG